MVDSAVYFFGISTRLTAIALGLDLPSAQPTVACSKLTVETPEQCLKSAQSNNKDGRTTSMMSF